MKQLLYLVMSTWISAITVLNAADKISIRFLVEKMPDGLDVVTWVAGEKHGDAFKLSVDQLSKPVMVPARTVGLLSLPDKRPLAKIMLPDAGDLFVVLLLPESGGTLKPVVIPASDSSFRAGDVFLYNHGDQIIVGHLGHTEFELPPGQGKSLRPVAEPSVEYCDVDFSVREETGDKVLRTIRWPIQTRFRSYGFFTRNPTKNRIEFRAVDEFIEISKADGTKR